MIFCPDCGSQMPAHSYFCTECGAQLQELPPEVAAIVPSEDQRHIPMPVAEKLVIRIERAPEPSLPFDFQCLEGQYGRLNYVELICPGVYYIGTKLGKARPGFGSEYLVVMEDSPAISSEAKAFCTPLPTIPRAYLCERDYDSKGRHVVEYEAHKYLAEHGVSLPEGESLIEDRLYGMEVCPEYFGEFPVPTETPWGPAIRCDRLWNGLFWLETETAGWVLAIAYPLCSVLFEDTMKLAVQTKSNQEDAVEDPYGYRFYDYRTSCLPLYELMPYDEDTWGQKIDGAALRNAVLKHFPDYGAEDERNSSDLPAEQRIAPVPGAGIDFYPFP